MDSLELLKTWPEWYNAGTEMILSSPAWRFKTNVDGEEVIIIRDNEAVTDAITLAVTFDGVPSMLSIGDSEMFPDLHLLWARRSDLPQEVLLALIEKECNPIFAILEASTRKMFSIVGVSDDEPKRQHSFKVNVDGLKIAFSLELPPELLPVFGSLENIDTENAVIRESKRVAWVDYGTVELTSGELTGLKAGDFVLKNEGTVPAQWITELPTDESVHIVSTETREISFSEFADDALPEIGDADKLMFVQGGREIAQICPATVGMAAALLIEERK